jgi:hypothetical protein
MGVLLLCGHHGERRARQTHQVGEFDPATGWGFWVAKSKPMLADARHQYNAPPPSHRVVR